MGEGKDKLKATAAKIKKEVENRKESEQLSDKEIEKIFAKNPALENMYQKNALVGAENLSGTSPLLKVHKVGKSASKLADGSEPTDGYFFYAPTQEEFKSVECHILTISRGFRAPGMEGSGKKDVFNQVMAGVVTNGDELRPFIMYVTGLKLERMWEFGKEASKYTKAKPVPIPMFALKIKLTTKAVPTKFGDNWVIEFEIVKDKDGRPQMVADEGQFKFLLDQVNSFQETIERLISARSSEGQEEVPHPGEVQGEEVATPADDVVETEPGQEKPAEKMPF